jgi:threonine synthase
MIFNSWYKCIHGCNRRYSIFDIIYRCEECGGLLEVEHDIELLLELKPDQWKTLFDQRIRTTEFPYGSGVWGKQEWVCPQVEADNIISMYEGHTNLFWAKRLGKQIGLDDLWVKLSGNSHTGSFKDLGMTVLVSVVKQMIADGKPIRAIACASTGDTSASLAAYAAAADIPAVILLPKERVSKEQLIQPLANGARVISLETDFDGCMRIIQELTKDPSIYLANSMNSLRMEGQKTVGIEIVQQFDWEVPDWIILPSGNLGNVSALGNGLLLMKDLGLINSLPRIVCAQSEKANPLYQSYLKGYENYQPIKASKTLASAIQIGDPVSYERAVKILKIFDGIVEQASEDELSNAAAQGDLTGMYNCPHTGVALAVLFKLVDRGMIQRKQRVIIISTAHGLKFSNFKIEYHSRNLEGVNSLYANDPIEIPATYEDVMKVIDKI